MSKEPLKTENESATMENSIRVSSSVVQRLDKDEMLYVAGTDDEERFTNYENQWVTKLASIDAEHSIKNGLDINEAETIFRNISTYTNIKIEDSCPVDKVKATDCLKGNKGNTLSCESETDNFKKCVDKLLYNIVRKDTKHAPKAGKKETYLETFERKYQV